MTTNLLLDARQRAMLAEMGVRVWLPSAAVSYQQAAQNTSPSAHLAAPAATNPAPASAIAAAPRREPVLKLPVVQLPSTVLDAPMAHYALANMPEPQSAYDLIVVGEPCTGESVKLLANILKVFKGSVFVGQMQALAQPQVQPQAPSLHEQITSLEPKLVLALGPHAAKALLAEDLHSTPLGKLRGKVHSGKAQIKVIVTYHPLQLMRNMAVKASSWQDVRLALRTLGALALS